MDGDIYLRRPQLSQWFEQQGCSVSVATLETWACRGGGPPFLKRGRWVVYRLADVEAWLAERTSGPFTHTSAIPPAKRDKA